MEPTPGRTRRPWLAALASLLSSGLGQVYAGRLGRGLVFLFLVLLLPLLLVPLAQARPARGILVAIVACGGTALLVHLVAILDAWRVARRAPEPYVLRRSNRAPVYAFFLVAGLLGPLGAALYVRGSTLEAYRIASSSMVPTLMSDDLVLVRKGSTVGPPRRGDVIVYRIHRGRHVRAYVKRVIGLAGEHLEIRGGAVWLGGRRITGAPSPAPAGGTTEVEEGVEGRTWHVLLAGAEKEGDEPLVVDVPKDHVFVLGDDRPDSEDSRRHGPVALADVVGPVSYVLIPAGSFDRFGVLR